MAGRHDARLAWQACDALIARLTGTPAAELAQRREQRRKLERWWREASVEVDAILDDFLGRPFPRPPAPPSAEDDDRAGGR